MEKVKKLIFFIVLNSFIFSNSLLNYNVMYHKELDKLYEKMEKQEKNMEQLKTHLSKPEKLEWNVIFSGFYEESQNGRDNTKENAKYYSKINSYYNMNKKYTVAGINTNAVIIKTTGVIPLDGL